MQRWIPFIGLAGIALLSTVYLLFFAQTSHYFPASAEPAVVYREACAECHGVKGEGVGLLYPALQEKRMKESEIRQIIQEGALFMPAFPNITDSVLIRLAEYVAKKSFKIQKSENLKN